MTGLSYCEEVGFLALISCFLTSSLQCKEAETLTGAEEEPGYPVSR